MFEKKNTKRIGKRNFEPPVELECFYCKSKSEPTFKEVLKIKRFINDRGKIISKIKSGVCSRHQRNLTSEIKKARFLALIPYTEQHAI